MVCSKCGGKLTVTDTVHVPDDNEDYRRRKCTECGNIVFTTEFEVDLNDIYRNSYNKYIRTAYSKGHKSDNPTGRPRKYFDREEICSVCGKKFIYTAAKQRNHAKKDHHKYSSDLMFCSRNCAGRHSRDIQLGRADIH